MAGTSLYEAYREALRRGHVAFHRGRFEEALAAYAEAAAIAPDRSVPHMGIGRVLSRVGRPHEAIGAFDRAIALAPTDEAALEGRAEVQLALDHRIDAARDLVALAEIREADGRLAEACDAARRALEIAESRDRRRLVERIVNRLRAEASDDSVVAALERAMSVLEPADARGELGSPGVADADAGAATEPGAESEVGAAPEASPDPLELAETADAALAAGDLEAARVGLLAAADVFRRSGQRDAALDACLTVLGIRPVDPDLHVFLAELYGQVGWAGLADEKLSLLGRLAELSADLETAARVAALVSQPLQPDTEPEVPGATT
jgi:tetratricopeptide (TPR) repeat protein